MQKYQKFLIPLLFALAIILGLIQRQHNPYLGTNKQSFYSQTTGNKSLKDYYIEAQKLGADQKQVSTVNFLAVGDIMLSRNVAQKIYDNPIKHGSDSINLPFLKMSDVLKSVNFNFGNLESPFDPNFKGIIGGHSMIFAAPPAYEQGLTDYNFQILNLANNHALDQGTAGLNFTNKILDENNIKHIGTGKNLEEAWQPAIIESKGIKICFIGASYASINDNGKIKNNFVARMEDLDRLKSAIGNLKSSCDFIIVTMHAGTEYTRAPNKIQTDFAHAAIDYGADMVIGAHPHWVQTTEKYCPPMPAAQNGQAINMPYDGSKCKYIFYSLGNFIFDQMWSQDTREGLTLKITISKDQTVNKMTPDAANLDDLQGNRIPAKLDSIELIPVIIDNFSTPRPATTEETKKILDKINIKETILK